MDPQASHLIFLVKQILPKMDAETKELYVLVDVNCNLLPKANAHINISSFLTNIYPYIYMVLAS